MKYLLTDPVLVRITSASQVALFLDFDGTLVSIASTPDGIHVPPKIHTLLHALVKYKKYTVGIISGRSIKDLLTYLHVPQEVSIAGSHGLEWMIRKKRNSVKLPDGYPEALRKLYTAFSRFARATPGVDVEWKGVSISVRLRMVAPAKRDKVRAFVFSTISSANGHQLFEVIPGKTDIDVRPNISWTKAEVIRHICTELYISLPSVPMVYIGDDATDEDVFRAFPKSVSVHVGQTSHSSAHYYVHGVSDVFTFLRMLIGKKV